MRAGLPCLLRGYSWHAYMHAHNCNYASLPSVCLRPRQAHLQAFAAEQEGQPPKVQGLLLARRPEAAHVHAHAQLVHAAQKVAAAMALHIPAQRQLAPAAVQPQRCQPADAQRVRKRWYLDLQAECGVQARSESTLQA